MLLDKFNLFSQISIGCLIFFSYLIRSQGIILLPVLFIFQIIDVIQSNHPKNKYFIIGLHLCTPYIVFLLLEILNSLLLPTSTTSTGYSSVIHLISLGTILNNIKYYAFLLSDFFIIPGLKELIYFGTLPIVIIGIKNNYKKDYLYIIFCFLIFSINILFPFTQGLRYVFPILPFYLYFLYCGFHQTNNYFSVLFLKLNVSQIYFLSIIFISIIQYPSIINQKLNIIDGPYHPKSIELFNYIKMNTPLNSKIYFAKPRVLTFYTQRQSGNMSTDDYNYKINVISKNPETPLEKNKDQLINLNPPNYKLIFNNNSFYVFEKGYKPNTTL